ncbi:MAG: bifunctional 4-hydroxy-2-oxoglutarate aldolase/2-dehydro-3-deoxy-phosphogluconate aldolase [Ostreibacterium sp.]
MSKNLSALKNTIIPVVVIDSDLTPESATWLIDSVHAGGSACLEITLRSPQALEAIQIIKHTRPDFIVGAGTVLDVGQAKAAIEAGVDFLVSPGLSSEITDFSHESGTIIIPGVITPTEIQQAMALGLELLKFFPAEQAGGTAMLKAFHAVYPALQFIPTGGININNLADYVALPNTFAVGGSWVCKTQDISQGNYNEITENLKMANAKFTQ